MGVCTGRRRADHQDGVVEFLAGQLTLFVNIAVHIKPSAILPDEPAGFMEPVSAAADFVSGNEFDNGVIIVF